MRIYWSLKSVPELANLPPVSVRKVHRVCFRRYALFRPAWFFAIGGYLACVCAAGAPVFLLRWGFRVPLDFLEYITVLALGVFAGTILRINIIISFLRPFYKQYVESELTSDTRPLRDTKEGAGS